MSSEPESPAVAGHGRRSNPSWSAPGGRESTRPDSRSQTRTVSVRGAREGAPSPVTATASTPPECPWRTRRALDRTRGSRPARSGRREPEIGSAVAGHGHRVNPAGVTVEDVSAPSGLEVRVRTVRRRARDGSAAAVRSQTRTVLVVESPRVGAPSPVTATAHEPSRSDRSGSAAAVHQPGSSWASADGARNDVCSGCGFLDETSGSLPRGMT